MKRSPRILAAILIVALASLSSINLALASSASSTKVIPATRALPSTLASYDQPVPPSAPESSSQPAAQPSPPPPTTKEDIQNDLEDLKGQYHKLIDDHPEGLVSTLITESGFTPIEDIDEAKGEVGALSDTDFEKNQSQWDKAHNRFKKHKNKIAQLLNNKLLMAMLNSPFPGKLHITVARTGAFPAPGGQKINFSGTKDINRSFGTMKSAVTRTAFTKDFAGLSVTVVPELANTCAPGAGLANGIDDLFIAKAVSLGLELIKELIPDDSAMVVPEVAAVTAWGIARVIELALDLVHAHYLECSAKKDGDALASDLTSVKSTVNTINTTVGGINSHTTSVGDNIIIKINTLSGKADTTNNAVNTVGNNVTTINNTVNNINTNVNTIGTKVDNANTNIDNSRTLIINNANLNAGNNLRLLIEADLATPDSSTPLGIFETPASKGGYLELVRTIVFETIKNLTGATAAQANATLASADSLIATGKYKAAYAALRKAYKSAAN